jgi:hypothetical protein
MVCGRAGDSARAITAPKALFRGLAADPTRDPVPGSELMTARGKTRTDKVSYFGNIEDVPSHRSRIRG